MKKTLISLLVEVIREAWLFKKHQKEPFNISGYNLKKRINLSGYNLMIMGVARGTISIFKAPAASSSSSKDTRVWSLSKEKIPSNGSGSIV
jgi:hypothetical protein